jgi:hypothetical protein
MTLSRLIFRIFAALVLILFFLVTYEPARCQTPASTPSSVQAAQH